MKPRTAKKKWARSPDQCPVCGHFLEVPCRVWELVKTHVALVVCASYCESKTCGVVDCLHDCETRMETDTKVAGRVRSIMTRRRADVSGRKGKKRTPPA